MSKNVSAHMRIYIYINIVGSHGQAGRTDQYFILAALVRSESHNVKVEIHFQTYMSYMAIKH